MQRTKITFNYPAGILESKVEGCLRTPIITDWPEFRDSWLAELIHKYTPEVGNLFHVAGQTYIIYPCTLHDLSQGNRAQDRVLAAEF